MGSIFSAKTLQKQCMLIVHHHPFHHGLSTAEWNLKHIQRSQPTSSLPNISYSTVHVITDGKCSVSRNSGKGSTVVWQALVLALLGRWQSEDWQEIGSFDTLHFKCLGWSEES